MDKEINNPIEYKAGHYYYNRYTIIPTNNNWESWTAIDNNNIVGYYGCPQTAFRSLEIQNDKGK